MFSLGFISRFSVAVLFFVDCDSFLLAWPHGPTHLSMDPDGWQNLLGHPNGVNSEEPPKPEPLAIIAAAVKAGGRVQIVIENGNAFFKSKPHEKSPLIREVPAAFIEATVKWRKHLDDKVQESFSGNVFVSVATFAIFADKDSIGNSERLIGYELQIRLPLLTRDIEFPVGIGDKQYFFDPRGAPHLMKSGECRTFLKSLM